MCRHCATGDLAEITNSVQISGKRRVQISSFKGATMVSIREFYEKDGKTLPGKKVSLLSPIAAITNRQRAFVNTEAVG